MFKSSAHPIPFVLNGSLRSASRSVTKIHFPKKIKNKNRKSKNRINLLLPQNVDEFSSDFLLQTFDRLPSRLSSLLHPGGSIQALYRPLAPCARLEKVQTWFHQGHNRRFGLGKLVKTPPPRRIARPTHFLAVSFLQAFFTFGIQKSFIRLFLSKYVCSVQSSST